MRSASDIDWLGRHGRTIAEERRPESRTQTGRRLLVKGRRELTQVLFSGSLYFQIAAEPGFFKCTRSAAGAACPPVGDYC